MTATLAGVDELLRTYPQLRRLEPAHLDEVAGAFATLLPEYFMNQLGPDLLARTYWRVFCEDPDSFGFVWIVDGAVVGFMTGTFDRQSLMRKVIARAPMAFVWRGMVTALTRPSFLKHAWGLILTLRHERARPGPAAELMSLGVLPRRLTPALTATGAPISPARVLLGAALAAMRERQIPAFRLYAGTSNHLACAMYRRLGFQEVQRFRLFDDEKICFVGDPATVV